MTTTAEKIKVMQAFEDGATLQYKTRAPSDQCWLTWTREEDRGDPSWDWVTTEYRIKPPIPGPLQCWLILSKGGCPLEMLPQERQALEAGTAQYHMRQVTPQDKQDRKDAARYRYWRKRLIKGTAHKLVNQCFTLESEWDERIDKAMQGGDAE